MNLVAATLGIATLVALCVFAIASAIHDAKWESFKSGYNEGYMDGKKASKVKYSSDSEAKTAGKDIE